MRSRYSAYVLGLIDAGVVEFVARCKVGGRAERMEETSRFVRQDGRWLYIDGQTS